MCMTRLENDFVSLDTLMIETTFGMLSDYMPEIDFKIIENPIICTSCKVNLKSYFKFVLNHRKIERNIEKYSKKDGTDSEGHEKLRNVMNFLHEDTLQYPNECRKTCAIKKESSTFEERASIELIKFKKRYIEKEIDLEDSYRNLSEIRLRQRGDTFTYNEFEKETKWDPIKRKEHNTELTECTYPKRVHANIVKHKDTLEVNKHENSRGRTDQLTISSGREQRKNFKSDSKTNSVLKCSLCTYEAKRKSNLKTHMLVHKDVSEIKMHRCSVCAYEAKRKGDLIAHMLVHKDASEIKMYKCSTCTYETKRKGDLTKHMVVHKDVSEIKMYKCLLCAYEARKKFNLETHVLTHKSVSERKMFKCSLCAYRSCRKSKLKTHMLKYHIDISELKMLKCS